MIANRGLRLASVDNRPWLIGGPARCGKTTLVKSLGKIDCSVAGLPVEGLFWNYLDRQGDPAQLLREYLDRPRWVDGARSQSARPIDFMATPLDEIVAAASSAESPLGAISLALDRFAADHMRDTWAVADYHPEVQYGRIRQALPHLRLAIVLRDPRESLCALLYWRHYPEREPAASRRLLHGMILWCLAVEVGRGLEERYPDDVLLLNFNRLVAGEVAELQRAASAFGTTPEALCNFLPSRPHFSCNPDGRFVTPAGTIETLLTRTEHRLIEFATGPWMTELGFSATSSSRDAPYARGLAARSLIRAFTTLGRSSPAIAKRLADQLLFPGRSLRRNLSGLFRSGARVGSNFNG